MVPKGDTVDVLYDHDVIVRDDRVEAVRPSKATLTWYSMLAANF
jgi:hypothetical protein